jgi:regulator of sigma E protease
VSWFLAFAGFAALIILHELGHFAAAKAVGMRVERFSLFFGRTPLRFQRGETEYGIGWLPLGGFVKITGMNPQEEIPAEAAPRAYYRQPVWKRIVVITAGPAVNIVLAFVILMGLYWFSVGDPREARPTNRIAQVTPGTPAAAVLHKGDRIVAVDGVRGNPAALRKRITTHHCAGVQRNGCRAAVAAELLVQRGGAERTVQARPVFSAQDGRPRPLLGFAFDVTRPPVGPVTAARLSVDQMWFFTRGTVSTIAQIFKPEKRKEISGVVGSYEVTRQSIELGTSNALFLLAVISLSLGVINLFPFLPLDGGHIFWALAEKVRGRAIPFSVMERAGFIGFALVIGLFLIGFTNDVGRLTGEGFNVR